MAIKPILFNSHMVDAILDGRKTVTRQVVKVPEGYDEEFCGLETDPDMMAKAPYAPEDVLWVRETWNYGYFDLRPVELDLSHWGEPFMIPLGDLGDFRPVELDLSHWGEPFMIPLGEWFKPLPIDYDRNSHIGALAGYVYRRDFNFECDCNKPPIYISREDLRMIPWRPPIQMPREAAQIWLRVTNVRVERLKGKWMWVIEFERCEKPAIPTCAVSS